MVFVVVRTRATDGVNRRTIDTMRMLRLTRPNHCTIVPEDAVHKGMLQRSKDWITWGEVDEELLARLLAARGRLVGRKRLTDNYVKQSTGHSGITGLAHALASGKLRMKDVPDLKPLFRLNPPKGGYGGNKRGFRDGGGLGYRGKAINKLVDSMLAFENTAAQGAKPAAHHAEPAGTHHTAAPSKDAKKPIVTEASKGAAAPPTKASPTSGKVK
ncbi:MAG TPA: 50S ribosomal protein L30 [Thermoplasmata archaeon]|nr:50S ribosomal protein L30 [Thermoplasmata archaeon]